MVIVGDDVKVDQAVIFTEDLAICNALLFLNAWICSYELSQGQLTLPEHRTLAIIRTTVKSCK